MISHLKKKCFYKNDPKKYNWVKAKLHAKILRDSIIFGMIAVVFFELKVP